MINFSGRCFCGEVTWTSPGPKTQNLVCHCVDCQRASSAPFTGFIGLTPDTVTFSGEVNHYKSSEGTYRGFCPNCGTRLYFKSVNWPGEIHMHAATLDDPDSYEPDCHVVMRSSAPWIKLADDLPKHSDFEAEPKES